MAPDRSLGSLRTAAGRAPSRGQGSGGAGGDAGRTTFWTWCSAVRREFTSSSATCRFDSPRATSRSTSTSRSVTDTRGAPPEPEREGRPRSQACS